MTWSAVKQPPCFVTSFYLEGFEPAVVRGVDVSLGERVPAFLIRGDRADFGWVFWEKFTAERSRKLFGSVARNAKGDWDIQLGAGSREPIHVSLAGRTGADPDHPSSLG